MRNLIGTIVALAVLASGSVAAQTSQTWTGKISDSMCKDKHPAGEHEGKKMSDADCTSVCVKKGAKYSLRVRGQGLSAGESELKDHRLACRSGSATDWGNQGRHHHGGEDYRPCQAREVTPFSILR